MAEIKVLCGASRSAEKYYFNQEFSNLPESVQEELRTICVLFTADIGGTLLMVFGAEGDLELQTVKDEDDFDYDEIGAEYKIRRIQKEHEDLFGQLEAYYAAFFLNKGEV